MFTAWKYRSNPWRRIALLPWVVLPVLYWDSVAAAQTSLCDAQLLRMGKGLQSGYQLRGDRCEGVYVQEVSSIGVLRLASLIESFAEDVDFSRTQNLVIEWDRPGAQPVRIRVESLRTKLYYRMDTSVAEARSSYVWPTDVLRALGVRKTELGICASTEMSVGAERRAVQFPVRIRNPEVPSSPRDRRGYRVVLVSEEELSELYYSLVELKPDGTLSRTLVRDKPLELGYYPPERGIPIQLPELSTSGMYRLDLSAVLQRGGSSTRQVWFYHRGS